MKVLDPEKKIKTEKNEFKTNQLFAELCIDYQMATGQNLFKLLGIRPGQEITRQMIIDACLLVREQLKS